MDDVLPPEDVEEWSPEDSPELQDEIIDKDWTTDRVEALLDDLDVLDLPNNYATPIQTKGQISRDPDVLEGQHLRRFNTFLAEGIRDMPTARWSYAHYSLSGVRQEGPCGLVSSIPVFKQPARVIYHDIGLKKLFLPNGGLYTWKMIEFYKTKGKKCYAVNHNYDYGGHPTIGRTCTWHNSRLSALGGCHIVRMPKHVTSQARDKVYDSDRYYSRRTNVDHIWRIFNCGWPT